MKRALSKPFLVFHVILFSLAFLVAQQTPPPDDPPQGDPSVQDPSGSGAAIAESGLLPVYGATIELDKSWVDGKKFPSETPVSQAFQQLFDTQIANCGFNVLRVPFDVNDGKAEESTRLANLCVWAQQRGIKIAPVLTAGPIGKAFPKDYATRAKTFVTTVLSMFKRDKGSMLPAYGQIAFYQLSYPLNQPANHGVVDPIVGADALKKAAADIRAAETAALAEVGQPPTQLMASASFDYELIKTGAIVGTEMSPDAFAQAYEGLKVYLAPLAESPEIGMFSVEWHPGSITSEATDKMADLVRGLMADVQGKLLVLSTGYSTAFRTHEDQSRFYALGFANLADLRASEGVDCPFTGVIWNTVINGDDANAAPPGDQTATNINAWDLSAKAAELVQMWQKGGGDPDLNWWWKKTRSSLGILAKDNDVIAPKQAHEVLAELQGATAQAAVESGLAETVQQIEEVQTQAIQAGVDPNAAPPVDPNTGLPIDPNSGQPFDPNNPPIDPNTGLPIQGGSIPSSNPFQPVMDDLKTKLNGALSELLGGIIEKGKMGISNLVGKLLGGNLGVPGFDPNAGGVPGFDPNTGMPVDPNTGMPIDPNTGLPIDPNTGLPIDPNTGLPAGGGGDPGGGVPGGGAPGGGAPGGGTPGGMGADLTFGGPISPLGAMTTNVPITISIGMRNDGDTPAIGATAYLIDQEGNAFAASEPITVDPGASVNAEVAFTPPSAGSIPGVRVQLFCDNEVNPDNNFADAGSISISDPPGGVNEGLPTGGEPVDEPGGGTPSGGTPGGGRPGGLIGGGGKGGLIGNIKVILPTFVGRKPLLGITVRNPGIVPQLTTITPGMFNVASLAPGSAAKLMQALSSDVSSGGFRPGMLGYQVGQPIPLTVPITNPFKRGFSNVKATLFVDGDNIATRNVGFIMPKQTRTVSFNEFVPKKAGTFNTEVRFQGTGPKGKAFQGRVRGTIRVFDPSTGKALIRPNIMTAAVGEKGSPRSIGGLAPTFVKPSIMRPTILLATGAGRPTLNLPTGAIPTRGTTSPSPTPGLVKPAFTIPVIRTMSLINAPAVSLSQDDVVMTPFPPTPGSQVGVSVRLSNQGAAPAKGVKVEAFADGKSLKSQTLDVPNGQQVVATQFDKFAATVGAHNIKVVATIGGTPQEVTRTFEVKQGVMISRPALLTIGLKPSLAFTGNDIQLNPIPQPNGKTDVTVNVRNPGGAAAANAEFEAFVDGQSLGKVTRTIGALQTVPVSGFPSWTSPAGSHTVKIVASIGGRQIAAEKPVTVVAAPIVRPLILKPTTTFIRPTLTPALTNPGVTRPTPGGTITPPATGGTGITRPSILPGGLTRPLIGAPDVGVSVGDLELNPAQPQPNADVTLSVKVHNFGGAVANGATLTMVYAVDGASSRPLTLPLRSIPAGGELVQSWKFRIGTGRQLSVRAEVKHPDDKNANNAQASKTVAIGGAPTITRPGVINPGVISPGVINPPGGGTTRPGILTNPGVRPLILASPDLAVASPDISYSPTSVKANDRLTFTIKVKNVGNADAAGAKLIVALTKDGTAFESKEYGFDAKANETKTITHVTTVPAGRQLVLTATVQHAGDKNASNSQAQATVNITSTILTAPRIGNLLPIMLKPDVALVAGSVSPSARSAKAGTNVEFTVKVQNLGRGAASNASLTVRFMVDGRAAGSQSQTFSVGAGGSSDRKFTFKVPPGRVLQAIATVTVSDDSNTGNNTASASIAIT